MSNFNLNSVAMLCEFNASVWTARKLDKKKSDDVVTGSGAKAKGAARVNKHLLAGRTELEDITKLVTEARNYVYENTTPWSDAGQRLIITARLPKFDARIEEYKGQFNTLVTAFVDLYPTLITAQAMALGDMFNRAEFPSASEIAHKFAISCDYIPVPAAGDIRVDIGNQAQDELRARLEATSNARLNKAMADVTERFVSHLKRMSDRLVTDIDDKTGEAKGRRFTETLVSSAFELCDLVRDYNVTGDSTLSEARKTLEAALTGVTVVTLRDDPIKREEVRAATTSILNKFSF
jgi:hypothetical protein